MKIKTEVTMETEDLVRGVVENLKEPELLSFILDLEEAKDSSTLASDLVVELITRILDWDQDDVTADLQLRVMRLLLRPLV